MAETVALSEYEDRAVRQVEDHKADFAATPSRPILPEATRSALKDTGEQVASRVRRLPGFDTAAQAARNGYAKAAEGLGGMTSKVTRYTLSEERIVATYQRLGAPVEELADIRRLDLKVVEKDAKPRRLDLAYAGAAAAEGAVAGLAITGGELFVTVGSVASVGVLGVPSLGLVTTVTAGDAAAVLALCSRAVAHTAFYYGYDPTDPAEEVFAMSVMNLGSAVTKSGKYAAYIELSQVSEALGADASWSGLNRELVPQIADRFARAFGVRLAKTKVGQFVPVAGIAAGAGLNYWIVQQVATEAYWTYRERFLNEKLGITTLSVPDRPEGVDEPEEGSIDLLQYVKDASESRDDRTPGVLEP